METFVQRYEPINELRLSKIPTAQAVGTIQPRAALMGHMLWITICKVKMNTLH
jgi:hypothetical protein